MQPVQRLQNLVSTSVNLYWPVTAALGIIAVVWHGKTGDMTLIAISLLLVLIGVIYAATALLFRVAVAATAVILFLAVLGLIASL